MAPKQSPFRPGRLSPDMRPTLIREATERSLLGAMLFLPHTQTSIAGLREEDFALPSHRTLFRWMRGLAETSRPIDLTTVVEELNRHGELDAIGGALTYRDSWTEYPILPMSSTT
jgi:replicative DNA helicase